ncbi:50S ribosomal protein 5 alpha, chloroplastic [Nymphaea colorata]|nr:50S ribosomal protein 5 alpha, chloroplastic [Nymphaea colorata]
MALTLAPLSSISRSFPSFASPSIKFSRFRKNNLPLQSGFLIGFRKSTSLAPLDRWSAITKASPEDEGKGTSESEKGEEGPKEVVSVENLPLESKLQMKLEAKLRMKLAKKIRLRRKRLVRKRGMRKKGRWPPSKMKKNKNV